MNFGFKVMIEGDYACFTRSEFKVERVSYDVPPPGALEGLLKSIYWKPSIRYVIDKIVVFEPINFTNVRRNEVSEKISFAKMKSQMRGKDADPSIYTCEKRSQRAASILKNVKYGIEFHFELTGLKAEREEDADKKHYNIIKRRLEKGQFFRVPCLGCSEFPVKKISLVDNFDENCISKEIISMGDVDFGFMLYKVVFEDKGVPINNDWENPKFSEQAHAVYYRPHMVNGVIDVAKYREGLKC